MAILCCVAKNSPRGTLSKLFVFVLHENMESSRTILQKTKSFVFQFKPTFGTGTQDLSQFHEPSLKNLLGQVVKCGSEQVGWKLCKKIITGWNRLVDLHK